MSHEFLLYLNIFSAIYYVVLIALIWYRRKQLVGALSLIGLISANLYALVNNTLVLSGNIKDYAWFFWLGFIFITLFAPFFRAHIYTFIRRKVNFRIIHISLIAMWAVSIFYAWRFYEKSAIEQEAYFENIAIGDFPEEFKILNALFFVLVLIYFIDSGLAAFKNQKNKDNNLSNLFKQSSNYIKNFWLMLLANYLIVLTFSIFLSEKNIEYAIIPLCMNVLFFFIVMNLRHYSTHYGFEEIEQIDEVGFSDQILEAVCTVLKSEKMYLNGDCSVDKVGSKIGESKNSVSRAINAGLSVSFNDYVNSLRISHAKDLLTNFNSEADTIEGIGYSSGFNSKASFYRAFKKFTSLTPTEFISKQKK